MITDFYGELIWHYGLLAIENEVSPNPIDLSKIDSVADLRREIGLLRNRWADLGSLMASSLFDRELSPQRIYRFRPFSLWRFITDLDPTQENFIGESIVSDDGELQYLKTYRLSAAQTRRAYLLKILAASNWNVDACAQSLSCRTTELMLRLESAGFGYMLHQHVLDRARSKERKL